MCGWALKPNLAATPSRATIFRHPAVVKGAPRSDANTNGDRGSWSRCLHFMMQRSGKTVDECTYGRTPGVDGTQYDPRPTRERHHETKFARVGILCRLDGA
jgi:hypothetical protein